MRESIFKRSPPQTPLYPSYPKQHSPPQAIARPTGTWPLPPAVMHYDFPNPSSYMQVHVNANASAKSNVSDAEGEESSPIKMPSMCSATQWST